MTTVSVAMATFNGAKFLGEQLDSLAAQDHRPMELVVCDDGSTDATLEILEEFQRRAPFPVRVFRNEVRLGFADNFLRAAELCGGDWVAFCDQDDVWFPDKLSRAVNAITSGSHLNLVLQNAVLCDVGLQPLEPVFPDRIRPGTYGPNRMYAFWVWPGFAMTVNAELMRKLVRDDRPPNFDFPPRGPQSHDQWVCMVANALGGICVLRDSVAYYRRHDTATTESGRRKSLARQIAESRHLGSEKYGHLGTVAAASAAYLGKQAANVEPPIRRDALQRTAAGFEAVSRVQELRSELYDAPGFFARLLKFIKIAGQGGYLGPRFRAMGLQSMLKDIVLVLFGKWFSKADAARSSK